MQSRVRDALILASALGVALAAQPQEPPAVDLTDPVAVAQAYVDACLEGDAKTVLQLLHPDDPLRKMMGEAAEAIDREVKETEIDFGAMWTEYLFLPVRMGLERELIDSQQDGGAAQVSFKRNWQIDQKIVLARLDDGTWRVKAVDSIKATRGTEESFLASQLATRESREEMRGPAHIHESYERLRFLFAAVGEYAKEHDKRLPRADRWVDEIEPYVLDPEMFRCPAAPDREYGYAMNLLASEQEWSDNWTERGQLMVLFEWPNAERNATAMPDELANAESFWPDGRIAYIMADQDTGALSPGMTLADAEEAERSRNQCSSHLRTLVKAARKYARDHDGLLPGADTWQDDIAIYLLDEGVGEEVFTCPSAPELELAYAINRQVAGKNARELTDHQNTILFFESDLNVPNAAGDPKQDAPQQGRHATDWDARRINQLGNLNGYTGYDYKDEPQPVE